MDILISAIVGDFVSRSASFMINKYCLQQPSSEVVLQRLKRVLLRINTIVEEAKGRHITNQGMLLQLKMLRQRIYRGYYMHDSFKYQYALNEEEFSHSPSTFSKFSGAKRLRFSGSGSSQEVVLFGTKSTQELQDMVDTLEDTLAGMKEFYMFLLSYPRMLRQPYSTYLLLDNCMFGRQTERERILNFLLQQESSGAANFKVLPIVGPGRVGKTTLVEHVCRDELVRNHFSMILFFSEKCLKDEGVINMRENINGVIKHQNCASKNRLLVIIEVAEDIDKGTWRRLECSTTFMAPSGSKVIITSQSNKIVVLGTTEALRLDYLSPEAYWHFFKMLAFGCTDPEDHPKMAAMAMEISSVQMRIFTCALVMVGLLRKNFNAQFWSSVLKCARAYKQTQLLIAEHPSILAQKDEPVNSWRLTKSFRSFSYRSYRQLDFTEEVPKITLQDLLLGSGGTLPHGEFEVLSFKSRIAPYYSYTVQCTVRAPRRRVRGKKGHSSQNTSIEQDSVNT